MGAHTRGAGAAGRRGERARARPSDQGLQVAVRPSAPARRAARHVPHGKCRMLLRMFVRMFACVRMRLRPFRAACTACATAAQALPAACLETHARPRRRGYAFTHVRMFVRASYEAAKGVAANQEQCAAFVELVRRARAGVRGFT